MKPLVVVGDLLLDRDLDGDVERVAPDAPVPVVRDPRETARPGGAGLAALMLARDGHPVTLVTATGADEAGACATGLLADAGVEVVDLGHDGATPEKVRIRAAGQVLVRVDRGDEPGRIGRATRAALDAIAGAGAVLVADYGRGVAGEEDLRAALSALPAEVPVVWDPHARGTQPVPGTLVVTPNRGEAQGFAPDIEGDGPAATTARARALAERWRAVNVCVTLGSSGALLVGGSGPPLAIPVPPATGDPCGAGDRFASALAAALAAGSLPSEAAAIAALAAAEWVAGDKSLEPVSVRAACTDDAGALVERVRAAGGTVVATGGCFDILHAGHVRVLEAARALGDCLVVCINSDESVRRLKGEDRPVVEQDDRAAVLSSLGCVDAVAVFGEDTPEALIGELRPDIWAKGGDYRVEDLPEARLLRSWGGQAVVLPYMAGRSTSRIIERVVGRGPG